MTGPLLIYVHDLRVSGVVKNALAIAKRVSRDRGVILCSGPGPMPSPMPDIGSAQLMMLPCGDDKVKPKYANAPSLRRAIEETGATTVMSAGNLGHHATMRACEGLAVETVFRVSNAVGRPARWWKSFKRDRHHRKLIRAASLLILVGQSFRQHPAYARALATGKAVEVANGVDVDRARLLSTAQSPHPWLDDAVPVVLGIGRIHPQKNFPLLLSASALAMKKCPHRLILLGGGDSGDMTALEEQASALGIGDSFLMPGRVENVFAWLSRAALFALVSRWEGSSNALLEAMAVGTPVLVTESAGDASAVLDHGRYGRLVADDDVDSVAAGLIDQLTNPVRPGDRADSYRADDTLELYAALLRDF